MELTRTFVSIDIPKRVQKEIKKIQNSLPNFNGKKTELENLHLTLKFLGEIDEEKIREVKQKLREIRFNEFKTELRYIGFFGNKKYGVVWIYLLNCKGLQKAIDEKLSVLFEPEKRFMSHLTIARVKYLKNKKRFLGELKKIKMPKIKFKIDKFRLKKSTLTPDGPLYETLEEYKLI